MRLRILIVAPPPPQKSGLDYAIPANYDEEFSCEEVEKKKSSLEIVILIVSPIPFVLSIDNASDSYKVSWYSIFFIL